MSRTFLKIKIMSLAAEARIIRAEERKWPRERDFPLEQRQEPGTKARWSTRAGLAGHRRVAVRSEARYALIAYGYLRGMAYRRIEPGCHDAPALHRILDIVCRFSCVHRKEREATRQQLMAWLNAEPVASAA
jgi:hypothetical protein